MEFGHAGMRRAHSLDTTNVVMTGYMGGENLDTI